MLAIQNCKGDVTADSEDSYVDRFMEEGAVHDCSQVSKIRASDSCDFNAHKIHNILYEIQIATNIENVNSVEQPPRTLLIPHIPQKDLHSLFIKECSYLRCTAMGYVEAMYPTDKILTAFKNIRLWMSPFLESLIQRQDHSFFTTYFHIYIDTQFLALSTYHMCSPTEDALADILKDIIETLVATAHSTFTKFESNSDMKTNTPFLCHCHRQLWLFVLKFYGNCKYISESFHDQLYRILDGYMDQSVLFCLWLLRHLYNLDLYDSIGEYDASRNADPVISPLFRKQDEKIQTIFNHIMTSSPEHMRAALKFINDFTTDIWIANTSVITYKMIWEYFYMGMGHHFLNFPIPNNVADILTLRQSVIYDYSTVDAVDPINPLQLFLRMLMKHLMKNPDDWQKLQSRFYTRFQPDRIATFHISVLHAVVFIYLCVAETNFKELARHALMILSNIHNESREISTLWNLYLALMSLHVDRELSITNCVLSFMPLVRKVRSDNSRNHLIAPFLDNVRQMLETFEHPSQSSVHVLLDGKLLANYMGRVPCHGARFAAAVDLMEKAVDCSETDVDMWPTLRSTLRIHIIPQMQAIAAGKLDCPPAIGSLAAKIAKRLTEQTAIIITFYTSEKCLNEMVCLTFITELLIFYPHDMNITYSQERLIIQAWVRCMFIAGSNTYSNTGCIFKLQSLVSRLKYDKELTANWQLTNMIDQLRECAEQNGYTHELCLLADHCFGSVDVAIKFVLARAQALNERGKKLIDRMENALRLVLRIIEHCGPMIVNNIQLIMNVIMLSREATMALPLKPEWLTAIYRVWPLYYSCIKSLVTRVEEPSKAIVNQILHGLIVRYIHYFPQELAPITMMLFKDNDNMNEDLRCALLHISSELMLDNSKISCDEAVNYICYIYGRLDNEDSKEILVRATIRVLMEYIMKCSPYKQATVLDLFKLIVLEEVNGYFVATINALTAITNSKMMFHGEQVMKLFQLLIKVMPNAVRAVLPDVGLSIVDTERRQGITRNGKFRKHLADLQETLNVMKENMQEQG